MLTAAQWILLDYVREWPIYFLRHVKVFWQVMVNQNKIRKGELL